MVTVDTFKRGAKNGVNTIIELAKVIIPVYLVVTILKHTFILDYIDAVRLHWSGGIAPIVILWIQTVIFVTFFTTTGNKRPHHQLCGLCHPVS